MTSPELHVNSIIYPNVELYLDYYETSIYKNQYKTTFENGGYIECSLLYPKAIIEPNVSIFDNGNKHDYQTDKLFLFSTENKTNIEDIITEDEEQLLQSISHDKHFNKQLQKYLSFENNTAGILVIKHTPITNGQNPLYILFIIKKREHIITNSINETNHINDMIVYSHQSNDFNIFSSYSTPLAFSLNSIIYSSHFTNNKQNKTEPFTINEFIVNKSKNVYLMKNDLCEMDLSSFKKTMKEGLTVFGKDRKSMIGMTIDASSNDIIDDPGEISGTRKSYAIGNDENKIVCDYITPDADKTEFYNQIVSPKFNVMFYTYFIVYICTWCYSIFFCFILLKNIATYTTDITTYSTLFINIGFNLFIYIFFLYLNFAYISNKFKTYFDGMIFFMQISSGIVFCSITLFYILFIIIKRKLVVIPDIVKIFWNVLNLNLKYFLIVLCLCIFLSIYLSESLLVWLYFLIFISIFYIPKETVFTIIKELNPTPNPTPNPT